MDKEIRFGKYEAVCITMVLLSMQVFLNLPRLMMEAAWTAAWILTAYISIVALLLFMLIARLYRRFEGKDLLDIGEHIAGTPGRVITGILLLLFFLYIAPVIMREFSENIKIISLSNSPLSFVMLFFITGMFVGAYLGIEAIVRFSAIAVPVVAVGYAFLIAGSAKNFDFSRITPILGSGPYEIFIKGLPRISIFAGIVLLYFMFPYIKTNRNFKSAGLSSIAIGGVFFTLGVLAFSLVYQYPTGTENFLPVYQLSRLIEFGRFFERVESIFLLLWAISALMYLSTMLFIISHIFKKTFRLNYYRPLLFPFLVLIYVISFLPENLVSAIQIEKSFRNYAWIIAFLLPLVLLLIARLVKKPSGKVVGKS